jgi:hypothetical protein
MFGSFRHMYEGIIMMRRYKRIHSSGFETFVRETPEQWEVQVISSGQNGGPTSLLHRNARTLETAKDLANSSILQVGHTCDEHCGGWQAF